MKPKRAETLKTAVMKPEKAETLKMAVMKPEKAERRGGMLYGHKWAPHEGHGLCRGFEAPCVMGPSWSRAPAGPSGLCDLCNMDDLEVLHLHGGGRLTHLLLQLAEPEAGLALRRIEEKAEIKRNAGLEGASCFVNAGLQAFLPLKGFQSLRPTTASERALLESRAAAAESVGAVVPQAVLDLYYQGRQEDCAEFLVELLADCPSVHRHLRGKEQAHLACSSCGYRRAMASEEFLTLQVPLLAGEHRLGSVQEALNHYLEREEVVEDIIYWACENPACSAAGRAGQLPKRRTTVQDWPETLVMSLNRWDNLRGLLPHPVHVDLELRVGVDGVLYRLESVVSHIGEVANSGHYVAYRPAAGGFERFDDSTILPVWDNPGHVSREKVYVVCYARVSALAPPPMLPAKRPAIDLEDDSDDSDVVVAPDSISSAAAIKMEAKNEAIEAKPMTRSGEPHAKKGKTQEAEAETTCPEQRQQTVQRKQLGNFANYAEENRRIILMALRDGDSFAAALRTIRAKVKHFTLHEKTSFRLNRNTLMGWFRRPELGLRAERSVTAPMPKAVFSRKPSRTSSLANLAPQQREQIVHGGHRVWIEIFCLVCVRCHRSFSE
ncbi:DOA4 [Symbiodinium microadriaticum]|nr:DOA4 [Symbiodinium microadriaticum]CAE7682782.1 DOA4 [Symbiodinium sp. KB8]